MVVEKGVNTFPKGISLKVNAIAQLDIKLVYYDVTVQHVSPYATETFRLEQKYFWISLMQLKIKRWNES